MLKILKKGGLLGMYRGIYGAASAMLVQEKAIDVTSNNLANIDTVGLKRRIAVNKSFPEVLVQRRGLLSLTAKRCTGP